MKAFTGMAEPSDCWSGAQLSLPHTPVRVRRIRFMAAARFGVVAVRTCHAGPNAHQSQSSQLSCCLRKTV